MTYPPNPAILADRFKTLRYDPEQDAVILLNRAKYPLETEFVTCETVEDVARAVETMIVQGGPPLAYAAGLGLALADRTEPAYRAAAERLLATRPTADDLHHIIPAALERALEALDSGEDPKNAIIDYVNGEIERGNRVSRACGEYAADLLADGDRVLTHCIAGAALCWMLWIAKQQGKTIHLIPTETRPYLQGARLTAQCAVELGIDCTLITDAMPAHLMSQGMVDKFICAADRVTMDGHITNKVGTLQIAIAAHYHGIPFYVLGYDGPDPHTASADGIEIEWRDGREVLYLAGQRTAVEGINALYPAFDITPPHLISAIVTDRGVFPAHLVYNYWKNKLQIIQQPTATLNQGEPHAPKKAKPRRLRLMR
ncbi:MAG TPA: S-methyl-5-thioribose-1-phosphate isomerase [Caldilineae bacterium]|nr:S-methyl-5-thioribose-1-phosphate isomerase [Caldilineae bacterium]